MKDNYTLKERLLNLCQKIYGPKRISEESINIGKDTDQIIEFARKNRLAHYLAWNTVNPLKKIRTGLIYGIA